MGNVERVYPYIVKFKLKNGITTEKKYESRRDRDAEFNHWYASGQCEWIEKIDLR